MFNLSTIKKGYQARKNRANKSHTKNAEEEGVIEEPVYHGLRKPPILNFTFFWWA